MHHFSHSDTVSAAHLSTWNPRMHHLSGTLASWFWTPSSRFLEALSWSAKALSVPGSTQLSLGSPFPLPRNTFLISRVPDALSALLLLFHGQSSPSTYPGAMTYNIPSCQYLHISNRVVFRIWNAFSCPFPLAPFLFPSKFSEPSLKIILLLCSSHLTRLWILWKVETYWSYLLLDILGFV